MVKAVSCRGHGHSLLQWSLLLLLVNVHIKPSWSFTLQTSIQSSSLRSKGALVSDAVGPLHAENTDARVGGDATMTSLDIVLFGTGDYRISDHSGLNAALASATGAASTSAVVPLAILDMMDTLPNMPMGRTHTLDTAALLSSSLSSLHEQLSSKFGLNLHVKTNENYSTEKKGVKDLLQDVMFELKKVHPAVEKMTVHTCDLGLIDNTLGYGPYGHFMAGDDDWDIDIQVEMKPWDCNLRPNAWEEVMGETKNFPDSFVDYETKFGLKGAASSSKVSPINEMNMSATLNQDVKSVSIPTLQTIPTVEQITKLLCEACDVPYDTSKLEDARNTGLYATHWGGLDVSSTFTEDCVLRAVDVFLGEGELEGDDALVNTLDWWCDGKGTLERNKKSLEHSAIHWMMTGGVEASLPSIKTESLIEGELLTRYLAAPLLFGMISPRYIWNKAHTVGVTKEKESSLLDKIIPSILQSKKTVKVAKTIVESREWHKLFAAKNLLLGKGKETMDGQDGVLDVGYWRWHGFLCRYVGKSFDNENEQKNATVDATTTMKKDGIALVHGFGASGSQWFKAIQELERNINGKVNVEALAPDLIGFGQCEKPSLTFTQYLWESYTAAFMKEIALGTKDWDSFVIGGNSIGGYTTMSFAADDGVVVNEDSKSESDAVIVSASGASGSGRCKGLILMNSAGKVFKNGEVENLTTDTGITTVAEATASGRIGESR